MTFRKDSMRNFYDNFPIVSTWGLCKTKIVLDSDFSDLWEPSSYICHILLFLWHVCKLCYAFLSDISSSLVLFTFPSLFSAPYWQYHQTKYVLLYELRNLIFSVVKRNISYLFLWMENRYRIGIPLMYVALDWLYFVIWWSLKEKKISSPEISIKEFMKS